MSSKKNDGSISIQKLLKYGLLLDVTETAKRTCIDAPVYITANLQSQINTAIDSDSLSYRTVLWDILNKLYLAIKNKPEITPLSFTANYGNKLHILWGTFLRDEKENRTIIIVMYPTDPIK